jgi:hypothetical protein
MDQETPCVTTDSAMERCTKGPQKRPRTGARKLSLTNPVQMHLTCTKVSSMRV